MAKEDQYIIKILDTNEMGIGIGKIDGMAVFVPGLLPGEEAEIRLMEIEKNYALGECLERLTSSEERIKDACPDAQTCGGCALGFATYREENRIKKNTVCAALRRARLPFDMTRDTVYSEERDFYRNKIALHYDEEAKQFGLKREKSEEILPFHSCLLCSETMNDIIRFSNSCKGLLAPLKPRSLQIRSSFEGIVISLYGALEDAESLGQYREAVALAFPEVKKVLYFSDKNQEKNPSYILDRIFGLDMQFTYEAFRQVNTPTFEKILQIICDFAAEKPFNCAADLYCGSGIIGLSLAAKFPTSTFWGIEINEDAIEDAKKNAERNGIGNIRFFQGDAATFKRRLPRGVKTDFIVVDPPRAGLSKGMRKDLLLLDPNRIVYVSCNPQTLARDLAELFACGYKMRSVIPVNMFPRTKHTETVVLLIKEETTHEMKLRPVPFAMIKSGQKTIELRLCDEKRRKIKEGDGIIFKNTDNGEMIRVTIKKLHRFNTFDALYKALPLLQCGYTKEDVEMAHPSDMEQYYSIEDQQKYGVVGIEIVLEA